MGDEPVAAVMQEPPAFRREQNGVDDAEQVAHEDELLRVIQGLDGAEDHLGKQGQQRKSENREAGLAQFGRDGQDVPDGIDSRRRAHENQGQRQDDLDAERGVEPLADQLLVRSGLALLAERESEKSPRAFDQRLIEHRDERDQRADDRKQAELGFAQRQIDPARTEQAEHHRHGRLRVGGQHVQRDAFRGHRSARRAEGWAGGGRAGAALPVRAGRTARTGWFHEGFGCRHERMKRMAKQARDWQDSSPHGLARPLGRSGPRALSLAFIRTTPRRPAPQRLS